MKSNKEDLTSSPRLARNVIWSFLGTGAPLIVALFAIPILIHELGTARFGVLSIAWMVVGYFSLFDLGIGRALTKVVAEKLGNNGSHDIPKLIWTSMLLMTGLGVVGGIVVAVFSPWLVGVVLKIPTELQSETLTAFYLLAASVPVVIGANGLRGVLEAHQRFGLVNYVRIPLGVLTFLGPVAVLPFSNSLVPVTLVLILARVLSWLAYAVLCLRVEPTMFKSFGISRDMSKNIAAFGGWLTVTNIVGPLMVYLDRFLIGAVISMVAVAYYVTPYEVVTKILLISQALMSVMFPAFSTELSQNRDRASNLFCRVVNYIFISMFPVVLIVVTFAGEGLDIWLGAEFSQNSSLVLQILAVGVFLNGHAYVPLGLVQSAGRPDLTAKLHVAELPFYLLLLWWLMDVYGIVGAALAWTIRVGVDAMFLFFFAHKQLVLNNRFAIAWLIKFILSIAAFYVGSIIDGMVLRVVYLLGTLIAFGFFVWFFVLDQKEHNVIVGKLKSIAKRTG